MFFLTGLTVDRAFYCNRIDSALQMIDTAQALDSWRQHMLPLRSTYGYYLISPSLTSAGGTQQLWEWNEQLRPDEKPDGIALQWYGASYQELVDHINAFTSAFPGVDLWLTEFACTVSLTV